MKSEKDGFYIGWAEQMSNTNRSFLKKRLIPIFIAIPILAFGLVFAQKSFNNHVFILGQEDTITGTYYHTPFPLLIADEDNLPQDLSNEVLLVGYGKAGAQSTMEDIQEDRGNLQGKRITLRGTLIHGDGKTLMELTDREGSLVSIDDLPVQPAPAIGPRTAAHLQGEILDPKCYFGVMKPGEGKIHKSCAIRCISGGIPPVFRAPTGLLESPFEYYLMVGEDGKVINQDVLPFVGEQISLEGEISTYLGWKILYTEAQNFAGE